MSIGNLKTDGNKGNNFPWQLRMLKGLQDLYDTNFETAIVVVECPGPIYTSYLEVRTWDQISTGCGEIENKLSEPTYYLPGDDLPVSGTIVGPGCVMRYTDDSTLLNDIRIELSSLQKTPVIDRQSAAGSIIPITNSISFAVAVTAATYSTISTDGGATFINVLPGETVIYDAGVLNNYFNDRIFYYDATGSDLLITYITP